MKKFLFTNVVLGVSALGLIGCAPAATNTNKAVLNINTNTAAMNSNMNTATINSNTGSNTNSNMSSNTNENVSSSDKEFIHNAAQGGIAEVQLGSVAVLRAQNDELRAFAQKMITDHSEATRELKGLAKQKGVEMPSGVSFEQQEVTMKLTGLSGAAFDKEYIKAMVKDHEKDVAEYQKQVDNASDADTKKFAAETLPTLKMHLEMIRDISRKIK